MSAISVRLPKRYHRRIRELAKSDGVSINQFIAMAVGEKISAIDTEKYLADRADHGDRQRFLEALNKVSGDHPTSEEDKITP